MHVPRHVGMVVLCVMMWLSGCAAKRPLANPSFPVDVAEAETLLEHMQQSPRPLLRPVVVIGGIYDPGFQSSSMARAIRQVTSSDARILHITCALDGSFDRCSRRIIAEVNKAFPSDDPLRTVEVDVVGFSMGGLVARYAASQHSTECNGCRLSIARLFTVSTPHRGANLAVVPTFDQRVIDMRHDSAFLKRLNGEQREYQLIPYARLGDMVVGEENAAPPGENAWWLPKTGLASHMMAVHDARILADIARRLRGETPLTREPAAPLPTTEKAEGLSRQERIDRVFCIIDRGFGRIVSAADELRGRL